METKENTKNKSEIERAETEKIDLIRLIRALWKKLWIVVLAGIIGGAASYAWTDYNTVPIYQSSAMLYVNSAISVGSSGSGLSSKISLATAKGLIDTYIVVLNTRETLNDVIDYAGLNYSWGQLKGMISAAPVNDTEIFQITVTSTDPEEAELIANAVVEILPKRISTIIEGASVQVVDHAVLPSTPINGGHRSDTLKGALLGMILSGGLIVLFALFDIMIRSAEDIEKICKYPILTAIPDMGSGSGKKKKTIAQEKGENLYGEHISFDASEGYKLLRTKIQFSFADESDSHVIGVSSALAGEGKSITTINLAYALAQMEKKVLLIDCDLRRPSVAARLDLKREPGLSNYLTRQASVGDVIQLCKMDDKVSMSVIVAGKTPPNPIELLSCAKMEKTMEAFRGHYDYILLDLPPIDEVSDAMAVSGLTDGMLMVVRQDYCDTTGFKNAIREFEFADAHILGIILNCNKNNGYQKVYGKYKKYYKKYKRYYVTETDEKKGDK